MLEAVAALANIAEHPHEAKYRTVKLETNKTLKSKVASVPGAVEAAHAAEPVHAGGAPHRADERGP